jgi:hypothetical protein
MFSIGDLVMLFGGSLILATCLRRAVKMEDGLIRTRLRILQGFISAFYRHTVEMYGGDAKRHTE